MCSSVLNRPGRILLALLLGLIAGAPSLAQTTGERDRLEVYTEYWPPYVNEAGAELGTVARLVRIVLDEMGYAADWRYFDYNYSYHKVRTGRAMIAFPFFRIGERPNEVAFSRELFRATSRLYYNQRFTRSGDVEEKLQRGRFGRVSGYRYGETIDPLVADATEFQTERAALQALLDDQIDFLPMTERVADEILARDFPNQLQLVSPVEDIADPATLHVIFPATPEGEALRDEFDQALERLLLGENAILNGADDAARPRAAPLTIASVVASEGFPIILARRAENGSEDGAGQRRFYAVPQGTRVAIVTWSERIAGEMTDDRLFRTMMDETLVVALNGPHVGREMYIRNMHLAIVE